MKKFLKVAVIGSAVLTASAMAAVDVSSVALDTAPVETIAGVMLGALGIIWVARKVVGFLR